MQRSQREVSKPPHHQSFSSCSSRVSICFWPILHLRLICSSTKSVLFVFESRTVLFFCRRSDHPVYSWMMDYVFRCDFAREREVNVSSIHSYIHCAAHSVNTHTDTLSVWPKTHIVHVKKRHAKRFRNLTRTQRVIIGFVNVAQGR